MPLRNFFMPGPQGVDGNRNDIGGTGQIAFIV